MEERVGCIAAAERDAYLAVGCARDDTPLTPVELPGAARRVLSFVSLDDDFRTDLQAAGFFPLSSGSPV